MVLNECHISLCLGRSVLPTVKANRKKWELKMGGEGTIGREIREQVQVPEWDLTGSAVIIRAKLSPAIR